MDKTAVKIIRKQISSFSPATLEALKEDLATGPLTDDVSWLECKRAELNAALNFLTEMSALRQALAL